MTVSTTLTSFSYRPGSALAAEAVPFQFILATDIVVTHVAAATGVRTVKVLGTDYAVTGDGRTGSASITALAAYPSGDDWIVERHTATVQEGDFRAHEALPAEEVELSLDRTVLAQQELRSGLDDLGARALQVAPGSVVGNWVAGVLATAMVSVTALATLLAPSLAPLLPAYVKGDPGGNAMSVGYATTIPSLSIPVGTDRIHSTAFSAGSLGEGGGWYAYKTGTAPAWGEGVWWFVSSNARRFELVSDIVTSAMFGTVADGTYNIVTNAMGGTDNIAALQAFIDYQVYVRRACAGYINPGLYRTTKPLHCGYGESYNQVNVTGSGIRYGGSGGVNSGGTAIMCDFSNAPGHNFQGARASSMTGLTWLGKLVSLVYNQNLGNPNRGPVGSPVPGTGDDTDPALWNDAALDANADSRYASYAAGAIDAYAGTRPGTSYPDAVYPAWLAIGTQWGKLHSSKIMYNRVQFYGFTDDIVIHPSGSDGNGDFVQFTDCDFAYGKYGIVPCQTQSRNVSLINCTWGLKFTLLTNNKRGLQGGRIESTIVNLSGGAAIELFDIDSSSAGAVTFTDCYLEGIYRLGTVRNSGGNDNGLSFVGGSLNLISAEGYDGATHELPPYRGVSPYMLGSPANPSISTPVEFLNTSIFVRSVASIQTTQLRGSLTLRALNRNGSVDNTAHALANNGLAGGLMPAGFGSLVDQFADVAVRHQRFNIDTLGQAGYATTSAQYRSGARATGIPLFARSLAAGSDGNNESLANPMRANIYGKAGLSAVLSSVATNTVGTPKPGVNCGLLLTLTSGLGDTRHEVEGLHNGGVIWDDVTGTTYFIHYCTGGTIKAFAQDNYKPSGTYGFVPVKGALGSLAIGAFYVLNTRLYMIPQPLFADAATGSATLTNAASADGANAFMDAAIGVNDRLFVDRKRDDWAKVASSMPNAKVSARDQAAKTITLTANPSKARTQLRIALGIRQPPASI